MKRLLIIITLTSLIGKSQQIVWMQDVIYTAASLKGNGSATDLNGNVFLSGGYNGTGHDDSGFFIYKYNSNGQLIWSDSSGRCSGGVCGGVVTDIHGNSYVSYECKTGYGYPFRIGSSYYPSGNMFLVKYNPSGNIVWVKSKAGLSPRAMNTDNIGNIYITGTPPAFTIKYDTLGNELMYSGYGSISVSLDQWGNIYIPGGKLDAQGNLVWNTQYAAKNSADENGNTYINDQGVWGESTLMKLNSAGQPVWSYSVPYQGGCAVSCKNGYVYVAGLYGFQATKGMGIYKYDSNGNLIWSYLTPNDTTLTFPYHYNPAGSISFFQNSVYVSGWRDMQCAEAFLAKYSDDNLTTIINDTDESKSEIRIFPNPAVKYFYVNYNASEEIEFIRVSDSMGKKVYVKKFPKGTFSLAERIDLNESKGVYFVEIKTNNLTEIKKLVLE